MGEASGEKVEAKGRNERNGISSPFSLLARRRSRAPFSLAGAGRRPAAGQTLPLVLLAALILLFAALWMADVHLAVTAKDRTQNAGDAAALAGARWQGTTLNLVGELNLFHALALCAGDDAAAGAITNAQLRALFAGPLAGVAAAQQAAKLNGAPVNDEFTDFVREAARNVRRGYSARVGGALALPEPWEGAWDAYADLLDALAADGIAAGIDNAAFYTDPDGAHVLLSPGFYEAVLGRDWCWFHRHARGLLEDYSDFRWWPSLPERAAEPPFSSELLGLRVRPALHRLDSVLAPEETDDAFAGLGLSPPVPGEGTNRLSAPFFVYEPGRWGEWGVMKDPSFPVEGELRPEYDYAGADAVFRVENAIDRLSDPGAGPGAVVWTGAAKPFGFLSSGTGGREPPTAVPFVLPAFREVRLIPLDASSMPEGGAFNLRWRRHCLEHLPEYFERGPDGLPASCRYCRALRRWEDPDLRHRGARWLVTNAWKCVLSPPGGSPGGGTRHAH